MKNTVYAKIGRIAARGASEKTGKMTAVGKYNYHTIDGVLDHLRPLLAEEGLVVTYSVTDSDFEKDGQYYTFTKWVEVVITDVETGHQVTGRELAIGIDKNDKGPGKATSYALKTFLVGTFALKGLPDENTQPVNHAQAVDVAKGDTVGADEVTALKAKIKALGLDSEKILAFAGVDTIDRIHRSKYREVMHIIEQREKQAKGAAG